MGKVVGRRVGKRMEQVATPTTDSLKTRLVSGKPSSQVTNQVTAEEKRRLIAEIWGTKSSQAPNFGAWVWHGTNTSVEGLREGLTRIIADELDFCTRLGIDPMTPELPDPHDLAHWAYLLRDSGYGEVSEQVVAEALYRVGYSGLSLRLATLSQGSEPLG